ncbi:MAG TPA: orotidine-5'-phosphate decarboxylase [Persephonella sp.]|nr:orotidine-5'-phosphate decarboxylase [Hydrogenothermaceae bacterium]HIQ25605.1 orotidine-5'-phosphate decarboxylase [Persephonella sp.]
MPQLAIALDFTEIEDAEKFLYDLEDKDVIIKVGYSLFVKYGNAITDFIKNRGFKLFLDLKLHDIPNTVYNGVKGAVYLEADYLTIHTLGGKQMLEKAVEAKEGSNLKLLGVTVLTSLDEEYLRFLGVNENIQGLTLKLANLAVETGIDGIVCSPQEVKYLKENIKKEFLAITPGIRPSLDNNDDQKRVMDIKSAIKEGSDILVIGRPIIKAQNPNEIIKEIKEKLR